MIAKLSPQNNKCPTYILAPSIKAIPLDAQCAVEYLFDSCNMIRLHRPISVSFGCVSDFEDELPFHPMI